MCKIISQFFEKMMMKKMVFSKIFIYRKQSRNFFVISCSSNEILAYMLTHLAQNFEFCDISLYDEDRYFLVWSSTLCTFSSTNVLDQTRKYLSSPLKGYLRRGSLGPAHGVQHSPIRKLPLIFLRGVVRFTFNFKGFIGQHQKF
jgi:hypothetical protein